MTANPDGVRLLALAFEFYRFSYPNRWDWPHDRMWDDFQACRGSITWDQCIRSAKATLCALATPPALPAGEEVRRVTIEECAKLLEVDAAFYEEERKRLAKLHTTVDSPYRDDLQAASSKRSALENSAALIRALSPASNGKPEE